MKNLSLFILAGALGCTASPHVPTQDFYLTRLRTLSAEAQHNSQSAQQSLAGAVESHRAIAGISQQIAETGAALAAATENIMHGARRLGISQSPILTAPKTTPRRSKD